MKTIPQISDKLAGKGIKIGTDDRTAYSVSPDAIPTQKQVSTRTDKIIPQNEVSLEKNQNHPK